MSEIRTTHYDDGKWCEQEYVGDKLDGRWTVYFADGNKNWERLHKNGRKEGYFRQWTEDGRLVEEQWYHLDQLHGTWRKWDEVGNEKIVGVFYWGYPRSAFDTTRNPEFNAAIKPYIEIETEEVSSRIDEVLAEMRRPTLRLNKKPVSPSIDRAEIGSYWNHVGFLGEAEQWPSFQGTPLHPILQIDCNEIPFADSPLKQFALITLFAVDDVPQKLGEGIVLRAYRPGETLVSVQPPCSPLDEPAALTFAPSDAVYPDENDLPPAITAYLVDHDRDMLLHHDEKLLSRLGGWPGWLQNGCVAWLDSFVLQVDSLDVENWNCGDATIHYFFLNPSGEEFSWIQQMC
ncbi:hypothetical protein LOC68_08635 [Blastopirellula sp. JC732]|uniref:DUF1963 domain-containing protein n=1 Tax=Blastopirellula sediminis TaxID=2894196 RepID=A0A9X1MMZ4_9BACT|nr:hypothetical protein [Blastopirellula sediminis]MCC9608764.1 hypothetical protein [Blastopirellula sediminis]MCC9628459.1 hypothetical protein [Blastopirellula sediminis]